jgi:hypothetical protein
MIVRRDLRLALLVGLASVALACRRPPEAGASSKEAGADGPAADGGPATSAPSASASAAASAGPAPTRFSLFDGVSVAPASYAGSYRCMKGLQLEQTGPIVRGTIATSPSVETVIVCNANGDTCTGTVRDIVNARGRSPKVTNLRPITLLRGPGGDLTVRPDKAKETRCPRL